MLIPNRVFPALVTHCDLDSSRYALGGIYFERDKKGTPYAAVTDGRRLIATTWTEPDEAHFPGPDKMKGQPDGGFSTIVPMAACKEASKMVKHDKKQLENKPILGNVLLDEASANGRVSLYATNLERDTTLRPDSLEGRFPM